MKPEYSDIQYNKGPYAAGICSVMITPREWLQNDPVIDFATGRVLIVPTLKSNKFWMQLGFTPKSYFYDEPGKSAKSGPYYEIIVSGLLNDYNYSLQQVLQTLLYHEFVVVLRDRNHRRKIVGNTSAGMKLAKNYTQKNSPSGQITEIILTMESEDPAPFYNPDNTPEILGNFLIDANGNYLLVQ